MSPFEQLGLPPDADERMIKRAYAQRLRDTRPDSDPQGFQRLHATYQAALAQCRHRTTAATARPAPAQEPLPVAAPSPAASAVAGHAATAPDAPKAPVALSFDRFMADLADLAARGDAAPLKSWLEAQPALWSLHLKARVGHDVFAHLYREAPPMPPDCLDALLAFFDMNHARAGHDPLALQRLQRRMQLAWELQPSHRDALAGRLGMRDRNGQRHLERRLARLSRPLRWPDLVRTALHPNAVDRLAQFVQRLGMNHPQDLPATCDPGQIRFWLQAADRAQVNRARLQIGGIRCLAALLGGLLAGLLLGLLPHRPSGRFVDGPLLSIFVLLAAIPCALWAAWMVLLPLDRWHATPEYQPARWPWLNLLLVPLLCAAALAFRTVDILRGPALVPALAALWLALRRLWRRNAPSPRFSPRLVWTCLWIALLLGNVLVQTVDRAHGGVDYPMLAAAAALLLWAVDLWRQRHGLRVRRS